MIDKQVRKDIEYNFKQIEKTLKKAETVRLNKESRERQTLRLELQAAARYIAENEVIHKKMKKDIPTVIEYQGRRYILDTKGR